MKEHWNIIIKGNVKKIDFLYYSELVALKMDLNGFIRNKNPGEVYMEIEGEAEKLKKLVAYFKKHPLVDYVDDVSVTEGMVKDFDSFRTFKTKVPSQERQGVMAKLKNFVLHLFS